MGWILAPLRLPSKRRVTPGRLQDRAVSQPHTAIQRTRLGDVPGACSPLARPGSARGSTASSSAPRGGRGVPESYGDHRHLPAGAWHTSAVACGRWPPCSPDCARGAFDSSWSHRGVQRRPPGLTGPRGSAALGCREHPWPAPFGGLVPAHPPGMARAMAQDEALEPADRRLLGSHAIVPHPEHRPDPIEQLRRLPGGSARDHDNRLC
jgi:hypothetical protein